MPATIDVKTTLGAVLIGCFIAIACVAHTQRSLTRLTCVARFLIRVRVTQTLWSCFFSGMHLLSAVQR